MVTEEYYWIIANVWLKYFSIIVQVIDSFWLLIWLRNFFSRPNNPQYGFLSSLSLYPPVCRSG